MNEKKQPTARKLSIVSSIAGGIVFVFLLSAAAFGQALPTAPGLQLQTFIRIPTWITSNAVGPTANVASFDEPAFNRVTGVMYIADRPNKGVLAIDTKTWTFIGSVELPGCRVNSVCSPSGALVAPDLQKLIITDRDTHIFVYDLRAPGLSPPVVLSGPPGQDELDYDPINQRAYIGNTTGPEFFITVIDLKNDNVLGFIPLSDPPEQPRFNPVDGLIYVSVPARGIVIIDPERGAFGQVINGFAPPSTCPNSVRAIDVDPTTNTAYVGCSTGPQSVVDLRNGAVLQSIPITGEDIAFFNPHNRRWYLAADNRTALPGVTIPCPKGSDGRTGVLGVISNAPTQAQFQGVACVGRGAARTGIDTINNNIYVPIVQYPADPNSADTGSPGVLVFHDTAPDVFGVPAGTVQSVSQATLATVSGSGISGTVTFTLRRRNIFVDAGLNGLPGGNTSTLLVVTTAAGNETINCGVNAAGAGFCQGTLQGDPMVGGVVAVGSDGRRVASGTINSVATFPTFIPTD